MSEEESENVQGKIKHDIKNQLSNITLALEQLQFETNSKDPDVAYYFATIFSSCKKITSLLDNL
jgi:hypothetical protein